MDTTPQQSANPTMPYSEAKRRAEQAADYMLARFELDLSLREKLISENLALIATRFVIVPDNPVANSDENS